MTDSCSNIQTVNFRTPNHIPDVVSWDDWDSPWIAETETQIMEIRAKYQKRIEENHMKLIEDKQKFKENNQNSHQPWNDYKQP